ncbi:NACHT domain-containing protein [Acidovorax valerianellae]|nr:NACHT domain-containing protein [Paracidovorax valerianellae]
MDVASAVDKFLSGKWVESTSEFVLCVSASLQNTQLQDAVGRARGRLAERNIALSVWDGSAAGLICERLKIHQDIVDDFFGRAWVSSFNGQDAAISLGDRLNGYELGALRARLANLYSVLFLQHDPGLRTDRSSPLDLRDRYVMADVVERTQVDVVSVNHSTTKASTRDGEPAGDVRGQVTTGSSKANPTTYEIRRSVFDWLRDRRRCVVLGEPGYGKSALLRYFALSILKPERLDLEALDSGHSARLPIWMSFSRFSAAIGREQGTSIDDFFRQWLHQYSFADVYPLFQRAVRGGQVLLLVDGLDEATDEHAGREALDRILTFLESYDAFVICTGRPQSYRTLGIPPAWATATLAPFSNQKIEELATRWFDFLEAVPDDVPEAMHEGGKLGHRRAQAFLREASGSPKTLELARNPLLCQSLIQLFRFSHQLPEARVEAYRQIVELLLSKHPAARAQASGTSAPISSLGLKPADLREMLIRLAREMQSQPTRSLVRERCEQVCTEFLIDDIYGLGESAAKARRIAGEAVGQLTSQYGVLVERSPGELGLLHLSIQEYLAAESVAREPHEDQLAWMAGIWTNPAWRESLIAWFGILGERGEKVLASRASQRLEELGAAEEWLRTQSIELRTEIATSDLGLSVSEARRIVEQAIKEVETSPFVELRTALAKSIVVGALGTPVRGECRSAIQRWLPGQLSSKRKALLTAFKAWTPSPALRSTLIRAFQDEEVKCRRAAAETFSHVFADTDDALTTLRTFAISHVQPEVRAAALHGLASRLEWLEVATECADANGKTVNAELFLVASRIRIERGQQTDADLNRLWMLWATNTLDFWIRHEPIDLLCKGWPRHQRLRQFLIERLSNLQGTMNVELPLLYLVRCYPGDLEVAEIVASLVMRFGRALSFGQDRIWEDISLGFRGNARISAAIRSALSEDREKYKHVLWDPQTAYAMIALGDEAAKNELIASYEAADQRGRYWIAIALHRGWGEDEVVRGKLKDWASGCIDVAAPLGGFGKILFPDSDQRVGWLREIAQETVASREVGAVMALLDEYPDEQTKRFTRTLLDNAKVWYYHRTELQGRFASAFPDDPKSMEILEDALANIDGPNPGSFATSFQDVVGVASRLLAAAVPAPSDVRMAVASVLHERATDLTAVIEMTPFPLAEEDSAVRASCLMARARAAKSDPVLAERLELFLLPELDSNGTYMDVRRRTALAALLELGVYPRIVSALVKNGRSDWTHGLIEWEGRDPVSVGALIEHWEVLRPLLLEHNVKDELPVAELVRSGYDALFERNPFLEQMLGNYFEKGAPDLIGSAYFDAFAQHRPQSPSLRSLLIESIGRGHHGDVACAAARVLAAQFSSQEDIWSELSSLLGVLQNASRHLSDGVLGHVALGWPYGEVAAWSRSLFPDERTKLGIRDRLLVAILMSNALDAEKAAVEFLSEPMATWQYRAEDINVLRLWAKWEGSKSSLVRWLESENPSLSLTAISLMAGTRWDIEEHVQALMDRFNSQFVASHDPPEDGLDAAIGRGTPWAVSVYLFLKEWPSASRRVAVREPDLASPL